MIKSFTDECKKMVSEKMLFVILMIIPISVTLLVGYEMEKGVMDHIPLAVVDYDHSNLSRSVSDYFSNSETFRVGYVETEEQIEDLIRRGKASCGMIIPQGFEAGVTTLKSPSILMIYDGANMSISSTAKAKATEILTTMRTGASIKQLEGRLKMTPLESYQTAMPILIENRNLYNPTKNFSYFILPGISISITQTALALGAVLSIKTFRKKSKIGYALGKVLFYSLLGSLTFMINMNLIIKFFHFPCEGSFKNIMMLGIFLAFAVSSIACAVSAWVHDKSGCIIVIGIIIIPNTIMAGYTWPTIAMPEIYQKLAVLIPFYHVADNVRTILLAGNIKDLNGDLKYLFLVGAFAFFICVLGLFVEELREDRKKRQLGNEESYVS